MLQNSTHHKGSELDAGVLLPIDTRTSVEQKNECITYSHISLRIGNNLLESIKIYIHVNNTNRKYYDGITNNICR
jgi:hypothetical protein